MQISAVTMENSFLKNLKNELPYDPAFLVIFPFLGIYPEELII